MHTNSIMLFANVNRSQISITDTHYNIKSIPITVDDAVMNNVHYDAEDNAKGIPSINGQPVTLSHPDSDGVNISGKEGKGLADFFSGGTITNTYNMGGVWYADASIKKNMLKAQDDGERYANALETKSDIGVSTGLTFAYNEMQGKNKKGQPYTKRAVNQKYDHLAMLLDERPAGGDATVMRFNNKDVEVVNINTLIDSPTITPEQEKTFMSWLFNKLGGFAADKQSGYNKNEQTTNDNFNSEDHIMDRNQLIALLTNQGITVNADISDADLQKELETALNAKSDDKDKKGKKDDKADDKEKDKKNPFAKNQEDVPAWAQTLIAANTALTAQVNTLQTSITANEEAEKAGMVEAVNKLNLGFPETVVNAMSKADLQTVLEKNGETFVNGSFATNGHKDQQQAGNHEFDINAEMGDNQ